MFRFILFKVADVDLKNLTTVLQNQKSTIKGRRIFLIFTYIRIHKNAFIKGFYLTSDVSLVR